MSTNYRCANRGGLLFPPRKDDIYVAEHEDNQLLVADESETVNFSWNFVWKVFLAMIVISLILSLVGYLVTHLMFPSISEEYRRRVSENFDITIR